MERIYTIDQAKAKMQKSVNYYDARINAWESVTRKYKKDGSDFKNLSQCFSGVTFVTEYGSNKIRVYFHTDESGYEHDDIYLDGDSYGREAADTAEKVQERIAGVIANYKTWYEKDKKGLAEIENQIAQIKPLLDKINSVIDDAETETNSHHTLRAYIKGALKIL